MADLPAFQQYQYRFARHIRNPRGRPRPGGIEARRMNVYNELLYNNVEGFLIACFPVLREVLGTQHWGDIVREFFTVHRSHTPFFRQIPEEFIRFLQEEWVPKPGYPGFIIELAHYEWIELALSVMNRDIDMASVDTQGDLLEGVPVLNPVLTVRAYAYPVHRISKDFQPRRPGPDPTLVLVFRDRGDEVRFVMLNPVSARLLQLIHQRSPSGRAALEQLAAEMNHGNPGTVLRFGANILEDLREQGAILGVARR